MEKVSAYAPERASEDEEENIAKSRRRRRLLRLEVFSAGASPCTRLTFSVSGQRKSAKRTAPPGHPLLRQNMKNWLGCGTRFSPAGSYAQTILASPDGPANFSRPGWVAPAGRRPDGGLFFALRPQPKTIAQHRPDAPPCRNGGGRWDGNAGGGISRARIV